MLAPYFASDGKSARDYMLALIRYFVSLGEMANAAKVAIQAAKIDLAYEALALRKGDPAGDPADPDNVPEEVARKRADQILDQLMAAAN